MATRRTQSTSWDRLRGESERAFQAFVTYRELGPARSLRKAYEAHQRTKGERATKRLQEGYKKATVSGCFVHWSRKFNWVRRVHAWDEAIQEGRNNLNRHLESVSATHRLRSEVKRHREATDLYAPLVNELIASIRDKKTNPLDKCRLLREVRELEKGLHAGFSPRKWGW